MSTKSRPPTPDEIALAKARTELRGIFSEAENLFVDLRKALGLPARAAPPARREKALEAKRIAAGQLMTKMGYSIEDSSYKTGVIRIVGPGFDATFLDIADFDGTTNSAID